MSSLLYRMRHPEVRVVERRREARFSCTWQASLFKAGLMKPLVCIVEDVSASGCRVRLDHAPEDLDGIVQLTIPSRQASLNARIVWKRGDEIGLSLVKQEPGETEAASAAAAVVLL